MSAIFRDVRYFVRTLGRQPGFAITVVLSLAIGIGANTVMFGVAKRILLERVAARDPESLVLLEWSATDFPAKSLTGSVTFDDGARSTSFSHDAYLAFTQNAKSLGDLVAFSAIDRLNVSAYGEPGIARGAMVSGNYYSALGVRAAAGRTLQASDDTAGAEPVAMMSYPYWRERFGGARDIIGHTIVLNGKAFTLVGIEPHTFSGTLDVGAAPQIIVPLHAQKTLFGSTDIGNRDSWWLQLIGRRRGSDPQIGAELSVLLQQQVEEKLRIRVKTLPGGRGLTETRAALRQPVLILAGAVTLVLLIACTNVAGLLLARATARRKEIAVRMSLGASRGTLLRQLLTESVILALLGGAGGIALAWWIRPLVPAILPGMPLDLDIALDANALAFTTAVCVLTGLVFGVVPALRATQIDLASATQDAIAIGSRQRNRIGNTLMVVQIALSLMLLVGCGLFLRSLGNLKAIEPGFDPQHVLLFRIDPTLNGYEGARLTQFYDDVLQRLRVIPGVEVAAPTRQTLISGRSMMTNLAIEGRPFNTDRSVYTNVHLAGPEFLQAMRIPLVHGRNFTAADRENAPKVAVVSRALARHYFGNENPVGKRIGFSKETPAEFEIVGIVADARYETMKGNMPMVVYVPWRQQLDRIGALSFAIRATGDPETLITAAREAVQSVDPNVPLFDVTTQTDQIDASLRHERAMAALTTFFGGVALILSCIGLYGLMSYIATRRTREMGVRIALGAEAKHIARAVLGRAFVLVLAGTLLGVAGAYALTRYVQSMLFGVERNDPLTIALAVAAMLAVSLAASWIPARRASKVDPVVALRTE